MKKPIKRRIRKDKDFQAFLKRNAEKIIRVEYKPKTIINMDSIRLRTGNPNRPVDAYIDIDYRNLPFKVTIRTKTMGEVFRAWETIQNPLTILHHTLQDRRGWEETTEKIFLAKHSEKARRILREYLGGLDKEVKEKLVEDVRRKLEEKILDLL